MQKSKTTAKHIFGILILISLAAFLLRAYLIPTHLFLGPEQGRDLLVVRDIVINHKLTLIGSKTDISGIFHGPLFYYLAAIPFLASHGNPIAISVFFIALQSISVFLMYALTKEMTKGKRATFTATILFSVAYGCIVFARWLSNPPLTIPLTLGFFLSFIRLLKGQKHQLIWLAVWFSLLGQAEFINFFIFGVISIGLAIKYSKRIPLTRLTLLISFVVVCAISLGNYVLFDLRHDFLISKSIAGLIAGKSGYTIPLTASFYSAIKTLGNAMALELGLTDWRIGILICIVSSLLCVRYRKDYQFIGILFIWLYLPVVSFILLRHIILEHFLIALLPGMILILALCLDSIHQRIKTVGVVLILAIVFINIKAVYLYLPMNENVIFQNIQKEVFYSNQLQVVDEIYKRAGSREFSFQSYTIPYFWQDGWKYLFWYVGSNRKLFIPYKENSKLLYVIIQKDRINPDYQKNWYEKTVSQWGTKKSEFRFGEFTVEELIVP